MYKKEFNTSQYDFLCLSVNAKKKKKPTMWILYQEQVHIAINNHSKIQRIE